ncbi:MAG: SDR family oxidoreductase [Chloroflexi bacterium]|nr:SDR family oxidoreductase [Chloroflexota bacterium]
MAARGDGSDRGVALVTGASAGIGAAFADRLARQGYGLVAVARRGDRLEALAGTLAAGHGTRTEVLVADLCAPGDLRRVEERAAGHDITLLVNNAGFGTFGPLSGLDADREEEEIALNVTALVRLTRAALPGMLARKRGGIINVSSVAAYQPGPFNATYAATKAFVNSFTEAVHEEVRGSGVTVQTLCPGFTHTEFQGRAGVNTRQIPERAFQTPEQVVDASLAALRRGRAVCIPGLHNKALATVSSKSPRALVRRVAGAVGRRY